MRPLTILAAAVAAAAALPCDAAFALEPLKTYDNFTTAPIDGALWNEGERSSAIKNGALVMSHRYYGSATTSAGEPYEVFRTYMKNPSAVTEMKAKITVTALEVNACATNAAVAISRARLNGSYYNIGTPVPGSQVGDALGQLRVARLSNSTDPAGILRVTGLLAHCTSADCTTSTTVQTVDLGTVALGTAVLAEIQWDQPNHQFLFNRDNGAATGSIVYTDADTQPPGVPFKEVSDRIDVANCVGSAPPTGYVSASFDNVQVNKSAAP